MERRPAIVLPGVRCDHVGRRQADRHGLRHRNFTKPHPGEDSESLDAVTTRWPDFREGMPPRPAVVVIRKADGGPIGT
jgi:hypothetical protein